MVPDLARLLHALAVNVSRVGNTADLFAGDTANGKGTADAATPMDNYGVPQGATAPKGNFMEAVKVRDVMQPLTEFIDESQSIAVARQRMQGVE